MIATLSNSAEEVERFRANPWEFQKTFRTPLEDLNRFVATALTPFPPEAASLTTYEIVFHPETLLQLMASNSIPVENPWKITLRAEGHKSIAELLEAALGCWIDFAFVPTTESFAIYADHDEYTTFYALTEATIKKLATALKQAGFEPVEEYERPSDGSWK